MKKIILSFISLLSFSCIVNSQEWHSLNTSITGEYGVLAETTYNGELYAAGWFYQAGNITTNNIARWNGLEWDSVGTGLTGGENYVNVLCVYNGKLFAGGEFFSAEGLPANNIASWDGSHWDTLSAGLTYCGSDGLSWADAMAVYNGKLYVAGAFCYAGNIKVNNIACWDGTKWDSVSSGINDSVYVLAVYNGNLYAGGQFTRAGNQKVKNIAYWNGTAWNAVGTGINGPVLALSQYKGSLYAGGGFDTAGGVFVHYVANWNGTRWAAAGAGLTGGTGVEAFYVFDGLLYAGGFFTKSGTLPVNNIASWNGTAWDTVSKEGINNTVDAFAVMDSALFAGGAFTRAGNINASDIAAWGGINLGINKLLQQDVNITIYPNPNNGVFTIKANDRLLMTNSRIDIYNVMAEKVYSQSNIQYPVFNINLSGQPAGVYLYRLTDISGDAISEGEIIIR